MINYASARRLTLQARLNALAPEHAESYRRLRAQQLAHLDEHTTQRGEPPAALLEQIDDWILTHLETGAQLPDRSPIEYQAAVDDYEVQTAARQIRNREAAARLVRTERAPGNEPRRPDTLEDLLEEPDEDPEYRISALLPTGGRAILAAQYKAGKSTLAGNLIRAVVDDEPFLGKYDVYPVQRVLLIDNELDPRTLKRWLRDQGIRNTERVDVLSLRGRVGSFDLLDPATRSTWARMCEGADLIILDCLRPILDALGLDESREAGRFLVAFDAFLAEAGAEEAVLVHHMGHTGERSRGDSRILDWPDVTWKLVREDADNQSSPRFFSAFGRDVDVPESMLGYDQATRRLNIAGGSRQDSKTADKLDAVLDFLVKSPGTSKTGIKAAIPGDDKVTAKALDRAVELGLVEARPRKGQRGGGMAYHLTPVTPVNSGAQVLGNSGTPGIKPGFLFTTSLTGSQEEQTPEKRCDRHPVTPKPDLCQTCKETA